MGGKNSKRKNDPEVQQARIVSNAIDEEIHRKKEEEQEIIKLLLLGAGESGKSTLFKQMIKIYGEGFSEKDLILYIPMIHNNTVTAMKELCFQSSKLGPNETVKSEAALEALRYMEDVRPEDRITGTTAQHIKILWAEPGIKSSFHRRAEFQLVDSADYFFDHIERISAPNFIPTDDDLIRCRVRTTGIVENKFVIDDNRFLMVDVGGQRNERKKWIHCFEGVTAVIFVAAASAYDQVLYEDGKTNRMDEALTLFHDTCHSRWFVHTSFVLFLNKKDLFQEKIAEVPITKWGGAANFRGDPNNYDDCIAFIQKQFEDRYHQPKLYVHVTCATDSSNVAAVFGAVKDIIIQTHLAESGLL